jgi:phenylacetate-coenzyme A ligase PaaK-like adenylate-forming protein
MLSSLELENHQRQITNFLDNVPPFSNMTNSQIEDKSKILNEKYNFFRNFNNELKEFYSLMNFPNQFQMQEDDIPWIPIDYFKFSRQSGNYQNAKIISSSGTSGGNVSSVLIDNYTAKMQLVTLQKILNNFVGEKRLPMLIIDKPLNFGINDKMSASQIAAVGFSYKGSNIEYAMDEHGNLKVDDINKFFVKNSKNVFIIFGFTFRLFDIILANPLINSTEAAHGIVIHGGGWKKMESLSIKKYEFKALIKNKFNISRVHDYYGMAEQAGSIYFECSSSKFHVSNYSDIRILNSSFKPCQILEPGLIQTISILPYTYPGFSVLTLDMGVITSVESCECGRNGKTFEVIGRINQSHVRGCSDT